MIRALLLPVALCCYMAVAAQSSMVDSIINPASCRQIVETLAADSFMGRLTGTPEGEKAGQYIADQFSKAGCLPGVAGGSFFAPFPVPNGNRANNVVAVIPGKSKPNEWVIFSAHYDHIGTKNSFFIHLGEEKGDPEKNDTIYN